MVIYTSTSYILDCERISWTIGPNGNRTAFLKDTDGCCRRIDNFDSSNTDYYQHDIIPLNQCTHLKSTEKVGKKLVATLGIGIDLCMIIYVCHPSRNGLLVVCRQLPELPILVKIGNILRNLLDLLIPVPVLKPNNQLNCIFGNTCYF